MASSRMEARSPIRKRPPVLFLTVRQTNMSFYSWAVVVMAAFDLGILVLLYLGLRWQRARIKKGRFLPFMTAILVPHVVHAFQFFDGAILFVQLAVLAGIFGLCLLMARGSAAP